MAWTPVPKPTGINWTGIPKPSESSITTLGGNGGEPIGMLLALTYAGTMSSSIITGWTDVNKPINPNWTNVNKPTT